MSVYEIMIFELSSDCIFRWRTEVTTAKRVSRIAFGENLRSRDDSMPISLRYVVTLTNPPLPNLADDSSGDQPMMLPISCASVMCSPVGEPNGVPSGAIHIVSANAGEVSGQDPL